MKTLIISATLIFSVMFSSTSFAEWEKVSKSINGDTFYVDFERIRKHDGYVYYTILGENLKPNLMGVLSYKHYNEGDCELFKVKFLSVSFHKGPMGTPLSESYNFENPTWDYPTPDSSGELILKAVCEYAK